MAVQTRTTALQGEYVRLYCRFIQDGILMDPYAAPQVLITDNRYWQELTSSSSSNGIPETSSSSMSLSSKSFSSSQTISESSSSESAISYGPFYAQKEHTGLWYIEWLVPKNLSTGRYFDIWKFKWTIDNTEVKTEIFELVVNNADLLINSVSPAETHNEGDMVYGLKRDLVNNFLYDPMHIPVYWEQGYRTGDRKTFNFAFNNWNHDPKPI